MRFEPTFSKVMSRAQAVKWREAQTGTVVFTNGVFDLLHRGHVVLLEAARAEGDVLIVGINTDASARRVKGPDRPVVGEQDRARLIAAFAAVDCVVLFEEDTPLQLIRSLEPSVLVKGSDYTRERTVGADIVEARGGRVKHIDLAVDPVTTNAMSTTSIVQRIRGSS
jgi:D-beta-D-heptose 7-phosphate kinase/D-beta-D-heptose 1-phosphate adenosyltransferase